MEVWEKVNYLLEVKNISKKDFADMLISLAPKLKRTGKYHPLKQYWAIYMANER